MWQHACSTRFLARGQALKRHVVLESSLRSVGCSSDLTQALLCSREQPGNVPGEDAVAQVVEDTCEDGFSASHQTPDGIKQGGAISHVPRAPDSKGTPQKDIDLEVC